MRDWHLSAGEITERNALATVGRGAANTKGSYTQVVAATAFAYDALCVQLFEDGNSGGGDTFLADIAIGAAASEVVIVPNLLLDSARLVGGVGAGITIPVSIPAGSRVAVRCQEPGGAGTRNLMMQVTGLAGGWNSSRPSCGTIVDYGTVTASTNGTLVDQGGTINTFGAWTQITASTSRDHFWLGFLSGFDKQTTTPANSYKAELEIGIGAAASEVTIHKVGLTILNQMPGANPNGFGFFAQIPSGTRIAARLKTGGNASADRHFTLTAYGG